MAQALRCAGTHLGLLVLGFTFLMLNFRTIFSHEPDSEMVLNLDLMVLLALIDSGMHLR